MRTMTRYTNASLARWFIILCSLWIVGCSSAYYGAWEKLGKHKRDLLKDNVEAARDEQAEAQEQFKDALTRLKELHDFDGGELEETYNALNDDYEECVDRADDVKSRIRKVDTVAEDLFEEWSTEIELISNAKFKADSSKKLRETRGKYGKLHSSMVRSEQRMDKVLVKFQDHVLYLKHNLNAQAIGGLDAEVVSIENDVQKLIADMTASIKEADAFISTL